MKIYTHLPQLEKIFTILAMTATTLAIIVAYISPARTYELSIYESTPACVWGLLIFSMIIAFAVIISQIIRSEHNISWLWIVDILILFLNRIIIEWMGYIRGYVTLSGDQMTHVGFCKDIIISGHISPDNFYPITHILLSSINIIAAIPILVLTDYGTGLISLFYLISIYVLSKELLSNKKFQILSLVFGAMVFFNGCELFLMPNRWSAFFIPISLYIFLKVRKVKSIAWIILLIVCLILTSFFHPLSSLFLIMTFLIIGIVLFLIYVVQEKNISLSQLGKHIPIIEICILSLSLLLWIMSFNLFDANIQQFYSAIIGRDVPNFLGNMNLSISKLGLNIMQFISLIINMEGPTCIFIILSLFAFITLVKSRKFLKSEKILFALFIVVGVTGFLYMSTIFNLLHGMSSILGERLIIYVSILMPLFVGYVTVSITSNDKNRMLKYAVIILLILCASILSIFSLYSSPKILSPGDQVTNSDVQSAGWALSNKGNANLTSIVSTPWRYAHLIYGYDIGKTLISYRIFTLNHFGYDKNSTVEESLKEKRYIMINSIDRIVYATVWAPVGRFNENDFERLRADNTANKIYSNGDSNVWYVL